MSQFARHARGLVAVVLVLGFVAEARAGVPRGMRFQRRGNTRMPTPTIIDSSPTIDNLNKALRALGATDRDYDGHREKAIAHVGAAIRHLETPNARGKSNAAIEKAAAAKTATTSQTASDESLRKARVILFSIHHQLEEHISSIGQKRADSEVRIAISEIVAALKPGTTPPAAGATTPAAKAVAAAPKTTASTAAVKPAK